MLEEEGHCMFLSLTPSILVFSPKRERNFDHVRVTSRGFSCDHSGEV